MYQKVDENKYGQVKYVITIDLGKSLEQEIALLPKRNLETGSIAECLQNNEKVNYYFTKDTKGGDGRWDILITPSGGSGGGGNINVRPIPPEFINGLEL